LAVVVYTTTQSGLISAFLPVHDCDRQVYVAMFVESIGGARFPRFASY